MSSWRNVLLSGTAAALAASGPGALAIGPTEQCAAVAADRTVADGRPHLWQRSRTYGTPSCTNAWLVDVTYSTLAPLPGTYLSWGDDEPISETACGQSALRMYAWDMTGAIPAYLGTVSSQGTWVDNDDPLRNPGASKVCHVAPLRAESAFALVNGRKYRFALRAEQASQNRGLVLANAPVPSRKGGNAAGGAEGRFLAIPTLPGERDARGWPLSPFSVRLESPDRRVARGGDLVLDGIFFMKTSDGYPSGVSLNFGYSNAMLLYQGNTGGLTDISCPAFSTTETERKYNYTPGWETHPTATGSRYCLLGEKNDRIYRLKVFRADSSQSLMLVGYLPGLETGRRTWGCLDGLCDDEVRIAAQYTLPTQAERTDFVGTALGFLRSTRSCLDSYLGRPLPGPLSLAIHAEMASPSANGTWNYGLGGAQVTTAGFEGFIRPGQTRVTDPLDLRYEVHEPMHVYNYYFFADSLPSWLDEGFAIQAEVRVGCGSDPRLMVGSWRTWTPGTTSGHAIGSELFKRLEAGYGCSAGCAAEIWRDLVDTHGDDTYLTNAKFKAVFEKRVGADLSLLFTTLGIDFQRTWLLPSSARIGGQGGSFYTTDLTVANPTAADAAVTIKFLGHDADGRNGVEKTVSVGAGRAVSFEDVLGTLFGVASGYGALRVSSSAPLNVLGQTWTPGPSGGTFGQSVPAMGEDDLIDGLNPRAIPGVREDARFRTNLILANASTISVQVFVTLLDGNGVSLASKTYTLPPLGMTQVTQVVRDLGVSADVANAVLLVSNVRRDAAIASYASVIDKTTNDPRTLLPARDGERPGGSWILPSSARASGQGGAFYTTRLTVANRTQTPAGFTLQFLGHDADGRGGVAKSFQLAAGRATSWDDLLGGVFGVSSGFGAVRVSSPDTAIAVLGETSTPGPAGGTFGQSVPGCGAADLVENGASRSIVAVRQDSSFRTNLILTNATEAPLVVDVKLLSGAGIQLASGSYTLHPLGMRQVTEVVRDLGVTADLKNGRLLLSTPTPGGKLAAYATVIDRTTNDPRTLLPR
jgi:hypothetical protein